MKLVHFLLLSTLLFSAILADTPLPAEKTDAKLMRLSLEVMLYNHDLKNAYTIAQKGAARFKKDLYWQKKAAQIALWLGKTDDAQNYYSTLYARTKSPKYKQKLFTLTNVSGERRKIVTLLEESLQTQYNPKELQQLYQLYYDLGYLERGLSFFQKLRKKYPQKEIYKRELLLAFNCEEAQKIEKSYSLFQRKYGLDKSLLEQYAVLLFSQKAYDHLFHEIDRYADQLTSKDQNLYKFYANAAYLTQHEEKLMQILEKMSLLGILPHEKEPLLFSLLQKRAPKKALLLAEQTFLKKPDKEHFFKFAYQAISLKAYPLLASHLQKMPSTLSQKLRNNPDYWRIRAETVRHFPKAKNNALHYYRKALMLAPMNQSLHESYLWYLIDIQDKEGLQKELYFLTHYPAVAKAMPSAAAVGYYTMQKAQQARTFAKTALRKDPQNWQALLLYADTLSLSAKPQQAYNLYLKAWQKVNQIPNICQKQESGCFDYLRLGLKLDPKHSLHYLTTAKKRVPQKAFRELYANYLREENSPYPAETDINQPKTTLSLNHIARGALKVEQTTLSHTLRLPHKAEATLHINYENFHQKRSKSSRKTASLELYRALKKSEIRFEVGAGKDHKRYGFLKTSLGYRIKKYSLKGEIALHEEDETNTKTLLYGYKNSLRLQTALHLNQHQKIGLTFETSQHHLVHEKIESFLGKIDYRHYFRLGYPDIYTELFLSSQHYEDDPSNLFPKDFTEIGTTVGIGTLSKEKMQKRWRAYTQTTLLFNNRTKLGFSALIGSGRKLLGKEYINIELLYASGIGKYQENYFSIVGKYNIY
jgi:hypothetical protein